MVEDLVNLLIQKGESVSTMESCTGGSIVNALTNIPGSSNILKFAAVTYSNDYKVRLGVDRNVMEEYSVHSIETARQMAFKISFFAESTYGIGVTGKFNIKYPEKTDIKRNNIFVSIYNSKNDTYTDLILKCPNKRREKCKEYVVKKTIEELTKIVSKKGER